MPPTPVTIITGFLGAGKTTLILNLIPQLPPSYKLALLKNEFGDQAVDSLLASSQSVSGVRELLNGCICCNLVGQLGPALRELRSTIQPDRIVVETSGSAFPSGIAMEVRRLGAEEFALDGVISVIDVENWKGYEDTSVTARMQARFTDLIVFNKWEGCGEERWEECLDRVGDLETNTAWVKSRKGCVDVGVVMGVDGGLVRGQGVEGAVGLDGEHGEGHGHEHGHGHGHQEEVEVLSVVLEGGEGAVDMDAFEELLLSAPKDEVYRIKGLLMSSRPPPDSTGERRASNAVVKSLYVLNWAFGRWTYTELETVEATTMKGAVARLTFILARGEASRWKKKLKSGDLLVMEGESDGARLSVHEIG